MSSAHSAVMPTANHPNDDDTLTLPLAADLHIHLREGDLLPLIGSDLASSGVSTFYAMPNLKEPITTTAMAVRYHEEISKVVPQGSEVWVTLYLHAGMTVEEIEKASASGVVKGVKSYPKGVTTGSDRGIESYKPYYPIFSAMQKHDLTLNIHGEVPSNPETNTCVLNAESHFLPHLLEIHRDFPGLRIVLEHATTRDAVECVKQCGDRVGCTITVHHLCLTVDDWARDAFCYCKPVAKYPSDREALLEVIRSGHPRFFLGTDSAPHPISAKLSGNPPAGVFTSSNTMSLLAHVFEREFGDSWRGILEGFACVNGRRFYGLREETRMVTLRRKEWVIPEAVGGVLRPFWAGKTLRWKVEEGGAWVA